MSATELHFADGSTLRNDFKNPALNPKFEEKLFTPEIPPDYKSIEPLKGEGVEAGFPYRQGKRNYGTPGARDNVTYGNISR